MTRSAPTDPPIEIETAPQPTASVIWLHGLGADGHDFEPIVPELRLPRELAVRFIFPHAPHRPVTINGGSVMRAWYDIRTAEFVRREDEAGIRESEQVVRALIAREQARGIPCRRIVLAGFSQGGAIALHTGVRYPEGLAGLMALSTYLPLADLFSAEAHPANTAVPVFMAHGVEDPLIPLERGQESANLLKRAGADVEWRTYEMGHSVCLDEIADVAAWLIRTLR
ncbi:MAG: alpha/beta hydrolase [Nitrospirae bacterium]|nr:alpha/beta hydrolase [Nitrospirota bacterium]